MTYQKRPFAYLHKHQGLHFYHAKVFFPNGGLLLEAKRLFFQQASEAL